MATVKNLSGNYEITVNQGTGTVTINGDLVVKGTQTSVETTDTKVTDNIITLNTGETGAGVSAGAAGIEVDRGLLANVGIRWNETVDNWQITSDGVTYSNIAISLGSGGSSLSAIYQDTAPKLGANLDLFGSTIYDSTLNFQFDASSPGNGMSGAYVTNNVSTNEELITKKKAIIYSVLL